MSRVPTIEKRQEGRETDHVAVVLPSLRAHPPRHHRSLDRARAPGAVLGLARPARSNRRIHLDRDLSRSSQAGSVVNSMSTFASVESLRNTQHVLTKEGNSCITNSPLRAIAAFKSSTATSHGGHEKGGSHGTHI